MSKHQEAINELKGLVHSELDGTRMLNEHLEHINTLQELVDKATPKKIIKIDKKDIDGVRKESITDIVGYMCECPNCKKRFGWLSISPYCRFCGQRLEVQDA